MILNSFVAGPKAIRIIFQAQTYSLLTVYYLFPAWEYFVPIVGTFHSQGGNKMRHVMFCHLSLAPITQESISSPSRYLKITFLSVTEKGSNLTGDKIFLTTSRLALLP